MKYTMFRNMVIAGGLGVVVGGFLFARNASPPPAPAAPVAVAEAPAPRALPAQPAAVAAAAPTEASSGAKAAKADSPPAGAESLRPFDSAVLRLAEKRVAGDKVKDALPGEPYKINLYVEGGRVVRAKVDLNRNEKWDEKWSFETEGGVPVVKRQVSPADDDTNYPLKYLLRGKSWVRE